MSGQRNTLAPALAFLLAASSLVAQAQLIVAHRGASHDAPENTLAAFQLAWEQDADAIEGDFYLTKDGEIACIHDKTTERVAPGQAVLKVAASTLAELQRLDVGSWKHPRFRAERIPTLADVLATVPEGKQILVEIKCGAEILPALRRQLARSGLRSEQILIICFDQEVIEQARLILPRYRTNWLTSYRQQPVGTKWKPTQEQVLHTLRRVAATGLGSNGNLKVIDRPFVAAIQSAGWEFHVWTVNDVAAARTFQSFQVDSITTDRPAFLREALESGSRQP